METFFVTTESDATVSDLAIDEYIRIQGIPDTHLLQVSEQAHVSHRGLPMKVLETAPEAVRALRDQILNAMQNR